MIDNIKFCRDCKYKVHYFTATSWNCAYDQTKNLITGEVIQPEYCVFNRSSDGKCKPSGLLFERKDL